MDQGFETRAEKLAQELETLTALGEDPGSSLNTHTAAHNCLTAVQGHLKLSSDLQGYQAQP